MFLEILWRDVTYGTRMLWQRPAYSAIAVLTLALGIGANTAVFTVVDGFMRNASTDFVKEVEAVEV